MIFIVPFVEFFICEFQVYRKFVKLARKENHKRIVIEEKSHLLLFDNIKIAKQ